MKSILAVLAIFGSVAFAADVTAVKVRALDGFGGDTSSVATRCQTKAGAAYDPVVVTRDVESLKASGEFEEITADAQRNAAGVEVTFLVKRKMRFAGPLGVWTTNSSPLIRKISEGEKCSFRSSEKRSSSASPAA